MESTLIIILVVILSAILSAAASWFLFRRISNKKLANADDFARRIVSEAEKEAEIKKKEAILEAKEEWYKAKNSFEREIQNKKTEIGKIEKKLNTKEQELTNFKESLLRKERKIEEIGRNNQVREKAIGIRGQELDKLILDQNVQLEKISGMTSEEAKKILIENMTGKAKIEAAAIAKEIKEKAEREAEKEAKEIITLAIQRCAADHTVESTVSVVSLPNDEMKGRIIGREGRNIRSFETATGIDVIVDDTPEAVILSGYDPIRREIARMALEKLVADGRIHPTRIEEVVGKAEKDMEVIIREAGEQAAFDIGIHGLHLEIIKLLGKLHFRTSYGQNVLLHSTEVAILGGIMASELKLDPATAKRAGLLHDIGKAIDRETEGTHTEIGARFLRKYNIDPVIVNAVESHHNDVPMETPYAILVQAADAVSGSRPGARREPLESYIKRLEKLEELADSFKGVSKAYAIQAGREVRVIVECNEIDDLASNVLASDIAAKIEIEMEYPGQIKVTVIREMRSVEYAK
ncbi:MAG: ribonuclease Y [candidate division Zixibacteria bacterium]|nr:ribonuclease Y [candidate division Zixibacteria bacterium]